ncbi:MAG: LysR substrate-binding domain-containing protein, partial [Burkholderiales bacterium]
MKLAHLQAFVTVMETGSIHAAARALGVTHPALSKGLRALEEELTAPLLTRSNRGAVPTAYGKTFYPRARLVLGELRKAAEDVAQLRDRMEGSLNIAVAPAGTMQLAPVAVQSFRRECPDVVVAIRESLPPLVLELLRDGSLDLAISPISADLPRIEFRTERLMSVEMCIAARPEHPLADARSLRELLDADWLRIGAVGGRSVVVDRLFAAHKLPAPRSCVECHSLMATLVLLQSGDYLAVISRALLNMPLFASAVVEVKVRETLIANQIAMIYLADRPLTRVAQIFATHLRRAATRLAAAPRDAEK